MTPAPVGRGDRLGGATDYTGCAPGCFGTRRPPPLFPAGTLWGALAHDNARIANTVYSFLPQSVQRVIDQTLLGVPIQTIGDIALLNYEDLVAKVGQEDADLARGVL